MNMIQEMNTLGRIVGGTPVEAGRFGFQAAILDNGVHLSVGSLIAPNVVLTGIVGDFGTPTEVALGCVDISDLSSCEVIEIVESIVSPNFINIDSFSTPTTLLILKEDSVQTPVAIAASGFDLQDGQDLTVIGRGTADPATLEDSGGILLETTVEALSQESCDNHYRDIIGLFLNSNYYYSSGDSGTEIDNADFQPFPITVVGDALFCAAGNENGPCGFGDFGGPTFLRCDATEEDVQVGFFLPLFGCANDGLPGLFSSLFQEDVFEFIQSTIQSQGHELTIVETSADFCVIGGTQPTEEFSDPPTPFPTIDLKQWTCLGSLFGDGQICHCNCGIPDPDCQYNNENAVNCEAEEVCVNAVCVNQEEITQSPSVTPTVTPTNSPTKSPTFGEFTDSPTTMPSISPTDVGQGSPTGQDNGIEDFLSIDNIMVLAILVLTLILLIATCHFYRKSLKHSHKEEFKNLVDSKELPAGPVTADIL